MRLLVSDASPLISLGAAGHLDLLHSLTVELWVPERVWEECVVEAAGRAGAAEISAAGWIRRVQVADTSRLARLQAEVDPGESEAIALASEHHLPLRIDERRGRALATREGVAIVGTLGVLLDLKEQGKLPLIEPVIQDLLAAGWRVSAALLEHALSRAGE